MMYNDDEIELDAAFQNYFKTNAVDNSISTSEIKKISSQLTSENTSKTTNSFNVDRFTANGNVSNVDEFGLMLKYLLKAAWGEDWGDVVPDFPSGDDEEKLKFPIITYDIVSREVADGIGKIKPTLINTFNEEINGESTGDVIQVYSQWFDCIVEFDVWGSTSLEAREILNKFEYVLSFYSGFLKERGVSEILFLKEISPKQSVHYIDSYYMKPIVYYIRLERQYLVRQNAIKNMQIKLNEYTDLKDKTTVDNPTDYIYNNNNIKYEL